MPERSPQFDLEESRFLTRSGRVPLSIPVHELKFTATSAPLRHGGPQSRREWARPCELSDGPPFRIAMAGMEIEPALPSIDEREISVNVPAPIARTAVVAVFGRLTMWGTSPCDGAEMILLTRRAPTGQTWYAMVDAGGSFSGVTKRYSRRASWVLKGIDLELQPGSRTVIVGGNGSGKSTLLRIGAGMSWPNDGTVKLPDRIGYVPEGLAARSRFSGAEYLAHMGRIKGLDAEAVSARSPGTSSNVSISNPVPTSPSSPCPKEIVRSSSSPRRS